MAGELSTPRAYGLPNIVFNPPQQRPLPPPIVDTTKLSRAQAIASMADALGQLPDKMIENYYKGRRMGTEEKGRQMIEKRLSEGNLEDMEVSVGPKGTTVSYGKSDPLAGLKAETAKTALELAKVKVGALKQAQSDYQREYDLAGGEGGEEAPVPTHPTQPTQQDLSALPPAGTPEAERADLEAIQGNVMDRTGKMIDEKAQTGISETTPGGAGIEPGGGLTLMAPEGAVPGPAGEAMQVAAPAPAPATAAAAPTAAPTTAAPTLPTRQQAEAAMPVAAAPQEGPKRTRVGANVVTEYPNGYYVIRKPDGSTTTGFRKPEEEGVVFTSPDEARKAGYDPKDAKVLPGNRIKITKFTPLGQDIKGKAKITDAMVKELGGAANLAMDMQGMEERHQKLYSANAAGPFAGRWNEVWAKIGKGNPDYVEANGDIKVANFRIARLLNGPGVLTDKDIERAQVLAPTLNETPESFSAKMRSVRKSLRTDVNNWKLKNSATASPELMGLADKALEALGQTGAAPETPAAPVSPAAGGNVRMRSPDGKEERLVPANKVDYWKQKGAVVVP